MPEQEVKYLAYRHACLPCNSYFIQSPSRVYQNLTMFNIPERTSKLLVLGTHLKFTHQKKKKKVHSSRLITVINITLKQQREWIRPYCAEKIYLELVIKQKLDSEYLVYRVQEWGTTHHMVKFTKNFCALNHSTPILNAMLKDFLLSQILGTPSSKSPMHFRSLVKL